MKKLTLMFTLIMMVVGLGSAQAAGVAAGEKVFLENIEKTMKISGQMASGKIPYNPKRAIKEMVNIQKAVKEFEADGKAGAPKNVVSCADKLKVSSTKGAAAAKAGLGAFKAVYGDLLNGYKDCQMKK